MSSTTRHSAAVIPEDPEVAYAAGVEAGLGPEGPTVCVGAVPLDADLATLGLTDVAATTVRRFGGPTVHTAIVLYRDERDSIMGMVATELRHRLADAGYVFED